MRPTDTQIAAMAAHLCDLAAHLFRIGGRGGHLAWTADTLREAADPEQKYREALETLGERSSYAVNERRVLRMTPVQIDDAVASILRGEPPADSLPGLVLKARDDAGNEAVGSQPSGARQLKNFGRVDAFDEVLGLLGCKVTP